MREPPAATPRRRRIAFRLGALSLGTVLALIVLELSLRVTGYAGGQERTRRVFDPRYGTVDADSWIFDFRIDPARHRAVDLRGQLVPLRKPPGETRVLFIGDSATAGAFLPIEQSFPRVFERMLRARDPDTGVRAINAGVWGMTTLDELHLLRDKLLPLRPDVVVLGLFLSNDINFNLGHQQRELRYHAPGWVDALRERSALAHFLFLQALAVNERHRLLGAEHLGRSWVPRRVALVDRHGFHMLSYPSGEMALYMREPSPLVDEAYAVLRDALAELMRSGRREGFELRVLLIPSPSTVTGKLNLLHHPNILAELRARGVDVGLGDLDFQAPVRRVLGICRELSLPCVDPTRRLRALGLSAFLPGDEHPSAAGHRALARALLSS